MRLMVSHGNIYTQMNRRQSAELHKVPASQRSSKGSGVCPCRHRRNARLRRGKDMMDWRELAYKMHDPGFGPQHFKNRGWA